MESIGSRFDMSPRDGQNEIEDFRALANYDQIPPAERFNPLTEKDIAMLRDNLEDMDSRDIPVLDRALGELAKGEEVVWTDSGPEDRCYFAVREVTYVS